jgi:hypothetical protein
MKPDWKDAPEWAQYVAMDFGGSWYWYEEKPEFKLSRWRCVHGRVEGTYLPDPETTLEQRP